MQIIVDDIIGETMRRFDAPPPRGPAPNKREREFLASRRNTSDMKGEIYVVWADYQEEISIDEPGLILPLKKPATTDASYFNWGSLLVDGLIPQGISTLSYSLLYYLLPEDLAVKYYVKFARAVVTHLPHEGWAIREVDLLQLIKDSFKLQEHQIKAFGDLLEKEYQFFASLVKE